MKRKVMMNTATQLGVSAPCNLTLSDLPLDTSCGSSLNNSSSVSDMDQTKQTLVQYFTILTLNTQDLASITGRI